MIDQFLTRKSAQFFRTNRPLSRDDIQLLLRDMKGVTASPSQDLFYHVKERYRRAEWSAICFAFDRDPSFLELAAGDERERIYGYALIIEYGGHIAILKSALEIPATFKSAFLSPVGSATIERAIATADAKFEKIRLRSMSSNRHTLRAKTLEANDLRNAVGTAGGSRYIAQAYQVQLDNETVTTTPKTGRISARSDRLGHTELVEWAIAVIARLRNQVDTEVSSFIKTFARPIDFSILNGGPVPTYLIVNVPEIVDAIFQEAAPLRLVRRTGDDCEVLNRRAVEDNLNSLDIELLVRPNEGSYTLHAAGQSAAIGAIAIGKTKISLKSLDVDDIRPICVEPESDDLEEPANSVPLIKFIARNDHFTVLFSDPSLAYIDGELYRDDLLVSGGGAFLHHFRSDRSLTNATDEKGRFRQNQTMFGRESVFRCIVDSVARDDSVLICDDLGDEWADFIGICHTSQPRTISFYHAKHGDLSLSASSFHVAVSQATKNLGNMLLADDDLARKQRIWSSNYSGAGVQSSIPRRIRGDANALARALTVSRQSPDTIRRVFVVTSSLSVSAVRNELDRIRRGGVPKPHFVQLYWLLSQYFSSCSEAGVNAYVVCQE